MEPLGDSRGESVRRRCMYARLRGDISSTAAFRVKGRSVDRFSALRSPPWPLRSSGVASPSPGTSVGSFLGCGGSGSGSGGGLTRRRSRLARCLRVVETALGLPLLLGDGVALELGLRGDGRLWQGGAVTAADMGSSSLCEETKRKIWREHTYC
jgi:hypothetical protein